MAEILSGQITVTTAGTAVQGTDIRGIAWLIRFISANTGLGYIGNNGSGDVASTTGYELSPGDQIYIEADNLNRFWFDTSVNGEKFCWVAVHK